MSGLIEGFYRWDEDGHIVKELEDGSLEETGWTIPIDHPMHPKYKGGIDEQIRNEQTC